MDFRVDALEYEVDCYCGGVSRMLGGVVHKIRRILIVHGIRVEVVQIKLRAFENSYLKRIWIPSVISHLGEAAFKKCESLSVVAFEKKSQILRFAVETFAKYSLMHLTIPSSLSSIAVRCFYRSRIGNLIFIQPAIINLLGEKRWAEAISVRLLSLVLLKISRNIASVDAC
jgi:hypothetical protein